MSLRINHNIAALDAHRNLTLTTRALSSSMEKLSSGYRINRASDDPAGFVGRSCPACLAAKSTEVNRHRAAIP